MTTNKTLIAHNNTVLSLLYLSDNIFASSSGDSTIKFWNTTTGVVTKTFTGHSGCVWSLAMLSDSTLVSGGGVMPRLAS